MPDDLVEHAAAQLRAIAALERAHVAAHPVGPPGDPYRHTGVDPDAERHRAELLEATAGYGKPGGYRVHLRLVQDQTERNTA